MSLDRLRHFACLALFAVWWGGLTLYALVVVPIGTGLFGAADQGFVTQQVTVRLNWLSLCYLAILLWHLANQRHLLLMASWTAMAVTAMSLFGLHGVLDQMLDAGTRTIFDAENFYAWHRAYLIVTALQWLTGLTHLWALCESTTRPAPAQDLETNS